MNFWHGGDENKALPSIEVPEGQVYGRLGREELLDLLDSYRPKECPPTQYGRTLKSVAKEDGKLKLKFADETEDSSNAIWACDGMNSLCRKIIQGAEHRPAVYSGMVTFRGKVPAQQVRDTVGDRFASETYMFIGVKGWHILIFPIAGGKFVNIAAFAREEVQKKRGRGYKTSTEELLTYFPSSNSTVQSLLKVSGDLRAACFTHS
jgi:salicylate hydroxylase